MEALEAFDLTGSFRDAGELAGCSHHTVARYVAAREAGGQLDEAAARPQLIDEFLPKVQEWVKHSKGKIRADKAHEKLLALGYQGSERTTRRAVHDAKAAFNLGQVRVHRPWVTEPGMWLQYDFGDSPIIDGRKTVLFCAWLAWSRFRVVLALRDRTAPTVFAALDVTLRRLGGAPTYVLTDNEKTVTTGHIAGMAVRNPQVVSFARHYGVTVHTCEPADPASKGGSESTVKLAKADLVPTDTNLLPAYDTFAELEAACEVFCEQINTRIHRVTRRAPVEMLSVEQDRLHPLPAVPHTVAFGLARSVPARTPMIALDGGQYSVPHQLLGQQVWVRVHGQGRDEKVIVVHVSAAGPVEVARHGRATPGSPKIDDSHFPPQPAGALDRQPKAKSAAEGDFLALGAGARMWLTEAAAAGTTKMRVKLAEAVALAKLGDPVAVDWALGHAAVNSRFAEADLGSIVNHHARTHAGPRHQASETRSLTQGTGAWSALLGRGGEPAPAGPVAVAVDADVEVAG
ncbi:MAG: IS21 family transposase [Frankiaceae bacterium]|nr:IS21 family transposase [Frankiaceae bacterium]